MYKCLKRRCKGNGDRLISDVQWYLAMFIKIFMDKFSELCEAMATESMQILIKCYKSYWSVCVLCAYVLISALLKGDK